MKNLQQFSAKEFYVAPSCNAVDLRPRHTILAGSGDSVFYGSDNHAGIDMEDDDQYNYEF